MDADHFGWIFPAWLLISPILFAFVPSGGHSEMGRSNVGLSDVGTTPSPPPSRARLA
jgi:hypothetical protein